MFVNNYLMGNFRLYSDAKPSSIISLLWSILKAIVIVFTFLSAGVFLYKELNYSRSFLLYFAILSFVFIALTRLLSQIYFINLSKKRVNSRKILIVGDLQRGRIVADMLQSQLSYGHEVIGQVTVKKDWTDSPEALGCLDDFKEIIRQHPIDEVIFALEGDRSIELAGYIDQLKKMGIPARILPALWDYGDHFLSIETCQGVPFLTLRANNINAAGLIYKRILDIMGGLIGNIILWVMYPFIAAAIKFDSPGPVFFKQKRMGRHGRIFYLYKFRSMYQDADEHKQGLMKMNLMNGALFKLEEDPRITRVGKFLRKSSLDEFPQFINVLKGEMSIVGTRPPTLDEVEKYKPEHLKRMSAKPGITGLWQVSGRNQITDFEEVVELDCKYLNHWRFMDDLKIIVKTVFVVLLRKGAK
jgi:exopolysaccharide biosynthesis polyprenyl glycosylphosphotransferase